jgi:hypothetical protein
VKHTCAEQDDFQFEYHAHHLKLKNLSPESISTLDASIAKRLAAYAEKGIDDNTKRSLIVWQAKMLLAQGKPADAAKLMEAVVNFVIAIKKDPIFLGEGYSIRDLPHTAESLAALETSFRDRIAKLDRKAADWADSEFGLKEFRSVILASNGKPEELAQAVSELVQLTLNNADNDSFYYQVRNLAEKNLLPDSTAALDASAVKRLAALGADKVVQKFRLILSRSELLASQDKAAEAAAFLEESKAGIDAKYTKVLEKRIADYKAKIGATPQVNR